MLLVQTTNADLLVGIRVVLASHASPTFIGFDEGVAHEAGRADSRQRLTVVRLHLLRDAKVTKHDIKRAPILLVEFLDQPERTSSMQGGG